MKWLRAQLVQILYLFQFAKKNIIQIKKQVALYVRDGPN